MCGRFVRSSSAAAIAKVFGVAASDIPASSDNIAPTQSVAAIVRSPEDGLQLQSPRWGLIPSWAKDPAIGSKLINARAETVAEKSSFRSVFRLIDRFKLCLDDKKNSSNGYFAL
jgi:putative SOS response-associated peptidase YedK